MPDPDYAPIQENNCENKQGGDTRSPHSSNKGSLDLKPRSKKQTNYGTKCENCLAMVLPEALSLHNGICNNFKMISNRLFECKICSDYCAWSRRYLHLKVKHKDLNKKMDHVTSQQQNDNQGDFSANPNKDMKDNLGLKPRQY